MKSLLCAPGLPLLQHWFLKKSVVSSCTGSLETWIWVLDVTCLNVLYQGEKPIKETGGRQSEMQAERLYIYLVIAGLL